MTRMFTGRLRFQNAHLGEWISTVADFLHPAERAESSSDENSIVDESTHDDQDRWSDPKHLDAYWATFLQTHKLEQNNRFVQEIPSYIDDETPSPLVFPPPPSPPFPSPGPSHNHGARTWRKRSLPVSGDDARATKRSRGSVPVPGSGGLRRSVRLEEKMRREARVKEAEKKRKEKEAAKRARAVKDKSENAKRGRKGAVGAGSTSKRSARGGSGGSESTKKSSSRSTRKHRGARSA